MLDIPYIYMGWCISNGLLAMIFSQWHLEVMVALCSLSNQMKDYAILRSMVKPVLKMTEDRLRYERVARKIFNML